MQNDKSRTDVTVLLVEDDDYIRDCLAELLADNGWRVTAVAGAAQALRMADVGMVPDVLVTDLRLGHGMNGTALISAARRRWPLVCAVLMSGADVAEPILARGDQYLCKPFSGGRLVQIIAELAKSVHEPPMVSSFAL